MKNGLSKLTLVAPSLGLVLLASPARAQDPDAGAEPQVIQAERWDVSPPLRDMAIPPPENWREGQRRIVPLRRVPKVPNIGDDPDPVVQTPMGPLVDATIQLNFKGNSANGFAPPDTNAAVGATQIMQHVNVVHSIYNKSTGVKILGPIANNSFWSGFGGVARTATPAIRSSPTTRPPGAGWCCSRFFRHRTCTASPSRRRRMPPGPTTGTPSTWGAATCPTIRSSASGPTATT